MLVTLTGLVTVGQTSPAAGQEGEPAPRAVVAMPTPAELGPTATRAHAPTSPAAARTATERSMATTSAAADAQVAAPGPAAQSIIGPESVIGSDGREKVQPSATSVFPLSAIGQIEFSRNGTQYICTGYLIDSNSVLTAGHCSYEGGTGQDGMIDSAQFFAARNRQNGVITNPFGGCAMTEVWAPPQWVDDGKAAHDYSVQQLDCEVGDRAGWFGLFSLAGDNAFAGRRLRVEGYPGDQNYGSRWKMAGLVQRSTINTLHYPMDTAGGQSGSPLFKWNRPSCGGPCSAGVHAYGAFGNPPTNSGPMLTPGRISMITGVAADNGG